MPDPNPADEQRTEMPIDGVEGYGGTPVDNPDELPEHTA